MKAPFTKGQKVTVYSNWSKYTTAAYRHATVHSCGLKVAKLIDDHTGEMFRTAFRPVDATGTADRGIHRRAETDQGTRDIGLKIATAMYEGELAHIKSRLAANANDSSYCKSMQTQLEFHMTGTPNVVSYHEACEAIRAAMAS